MKRSAFAQWHGGLKDGQGLLSTESGTLSNINYTFAKRFEGARGTNPEELIGAAHAGCFAMALSGEFEAINLKAASIEVKAEVSLKKINNDWSISNVHLFVKARVPGASYIEAQECAENAKHHCPVSKLLKATISMDFELLEPEEQLTIL